MKGRRILFVAPSAHLLGGVPDWLDYCLPGLRDLGWEPMLALTEGHHHDVPGYLSRHPFEPTVAVANSTGSQEGRVRALVSTILQLQPDIVAQVNIADCYEAVRRVKLSRRNNTLRHVVCVHGMLADMLEHLRVDSDTIDGVIASNKLAAAVASRRYDVPVDRVHYAPCGVHCPPEGVREPAARDNPPHLLRLLYVGRLEQEQKRVLDLPIIIRELFDQGVQVELTIAGDGPEMNRLRSEFDLHHVQHAVRFSGVLSANDLAIEYRRHDALVICSSWETGPIVAWEAMSYGLPVVSSRYVGLELEGALIHGKNCLLFPVGDALAAAAEAARLLNSDLRVTLAAEATTLARERYTQRASVTAWEAAFASVMRQGPVAPSPARNRSPGGVSRLDRVFGLALADKLRQLLGISHVHHEPGGEWPHTYYIHSSDESAFLAEMGALEHTANWPA